MHTIPNPDGVGRVWVTFVAFATGEPATVDDPRMVSGKRQVDQVRVRFEEGEREGTTALVPATDVVPPFFSDVAHLERKETPGQ
jgi:hypothetical protein